jgi:two-component system response regulator HydG
MEGIDYKRHPILYIDDDKDNRETFLSECASSFSVFCVPGIEEADEVLRRETVCIVISDNRMPGGKGQPVHDNCGLSYLARIRKAHPGILRALITSVPEHSRKMPFPLLNDAGVEEWIDSWSIPPWEARIKELIEKHVSENIYCEGTRPRERPFDGMVGRSKAMQALREQIDRVCERGIKEPILIVGESGVGKELVARAIHTKKFGRGKPWITLSIANLTGQTAQSALFGHCKGAFTGAIEDKPGAFEAAAGGTLLLDDIDYLDLNVQVQLLRVLQEKEVKRIGEGHKTARPVDVQVICTSNKDLERLVRQGKFSGDLYNRITWFVIEVPPLRDRAEDIWALTRHFLRTFNERAASEGKTRFVNGIEIEAFRALMLQTWSRGNVRELQEILHAAWINASKDRITIADLPRKIGIVPDETRDRTGSTLTPWQRIDAEAEKAKHLARKRAIIRAYIQACGGRKAAAEILGLNQDPEISRVQLHAYLKQTGLLEQLDLECTRIVNQCWVDSDKDPERAADLLSQTLMELSPTMPEPDITGTQFEELLAKLHVPK